MVEAFANTLKALLVSVLSRRKNYVLKSLSAFLVLVWVFLSVSLYLEPLHSQAATGLTMLLLTLNRQMYFTSTG